MWLSKRACDAPGRLLDCMTSMDEASSTGGRGTTLSAQHCLKATVNATLLLTAGNAAAGTTTPIKRSLRATTARTAAQITPARNANATACGRLRRSKRLVTPEMTFFTVRSE